MNIRILSIILLTVLILSACTLPSGAPPPVNEAPAPSPTLENTLPPPTATIPPPPSETPLPTNTPLPTATFTPSVPIALPTDLNVNCRLGYGTEWLATGALMAGEPATIIGKNQTASWWYVKLQNGTQCWVAASVTNTSGNLVGVPVIGQSTASVIGVSIEKPDDITVAGCLGPIQPLNLKGSIETNGPGTVTWHFESEQSGVITDHATDFSEASSKSVSDSFVPPLVAGSYWVKLVAFLPNDKVAESSYKIECP
ncbi:MAG: hypothetical protein HN916_06050 [Anaerolineae bacterium]|jgi:hypothetical protein|nr:hypothetical protein [Anaerolineae bacterium]